MMRGLILSLTLAIAASAAVPITVHDPAFLGRKKDDVILSAPFIEFVTNLTSTTDGTFFQTAEFTPRSNAFLIAHFLNDVAGGATTVTNTGTTNLTWWTATGTNNASDIHRITVTQLPIGTAPFAMRVTFGSGGQTSVGIEAHIYQAIGANTAQLWGSNAVVQAFSTGATTLNPYEFIFPATTTVGNAVFLGLGMNTGVDTTYEPIWVFALHTGHTSATQEMDSLYNTNAVVGISSTFTTNGFTRYHSMIEIRP